MKIEIFKNLFKKQFGLIILLTLANMSLLEARPRYRSDAYSKTVINVSGTGMEDTVESVSNCKLYVNGTEERDLINILGIIRFREIDKCYQACGSVTFKDSKRYVLYDDDGYPIGGTETSNTQRAATKFCGITNCATRDVVSSCQNELQPYLNICRASGGCGAFGGSGYRGRGGTNSYYQRPNIVDPDYPETYQDN